MFLRVQFNYRSEMYKENEGLWNIFNAGSAFSDIFVPLSLNDVTQ